MHPARRRPGATLHADGVEFTAVSGSASRIELLLYDSAAAAAPARTAELSHVEGPLWSVFIPGAAAGQLYAYRVHGPFDPAGGHRFNPAKVLLDPYARAVRPLPVWQDTLAPGETDPLGGGVHAPDDRDTAASAPLGVVIDETFDWQGVSRPRVQPTDRLIYETHVKGTTMLHPDVPEELRGSYLGLSHPAMIDHFLRLGVTTVQLLPVHAIVQDERLFRLGLRNYWGYNTLAFLAPEPGYASDGDGVTAVTEFRTMVRELHRAGLEVFLDVVYNHTGEGNEHGPTLNLRGFDNAGYYRLKAGSGGYPDVTGTGNTLDLGKPAALGLTMESLRWWTAEMGVDGFRFDLATTLGRTGTGFSDRAPLLQAMTQDPLLADAVFIAEPWDVGLGGYQLGSFPWRFGEWNDRFRDTARAQWHAGGAARSELATRLLGSSSEFSAGGRKPYHSVNFVTAHDGFTLADLLSYSQKHNEANGEQGRDGNDFENSRNYGVEGPTGDPAVLARREQARRGLLALLLLSQGTPMLLGGDEIGRSQRGNNNAYCQDNGISWFDWNLSDRQRELLAWTAELTALRRAHPQFRRGDWLTGEPDGSGRRDAVWLNRNGRELHNGDWEAGDSGVLCCLLAGLPGSDREAGRRDLLLVIHGDEATELTAPVGFGPLWSSAGPNGIRLLPDGKFGLAACAVSVLQREPREAASGAGQRM